MDTVSEQRIASVIHYIQSKSEKGIETYFEVIPEQFYVPSIYFPIPMTSGSKSTLESYCTEITVECWFMAHENWDAHIAAARVRDAIMIDNCSIPVINQDGSESGKYMRIGVPETKKIDDGIVQLSFSMNVYFKAAPEAGTPMEHFYMEWGKMVKENAG